jgi:hypothetical protein
MTPPFWLDDNGHELPTRKCAHPSCDREYPLRRYQYRHLRMIGWELYRVASFTSWCGHGQEFIPIPDERNWVRLLRLSGRRDSPIEQRSPTHKGTHRLAPNED